jgi:hypothetical protein
VKHRVPAKAICSAGPMSSSRPLLATARRVLEFGALRRVAAGEQKERAAPDGGCGTKGGTRLARCPGAAVALFARSNGCRRGMGASQRSLRSGPHVATIVVAGRPEGRCRARQTPMKVMVHQ